MKRHKTIICCILLLCMSGVIFMYSGCSTKRSFQGQPREEEDWDDIDALLGLTDEPAQQEKQDDAKEDVIEEDDVLKLLGVTDAGKTAEPPVTQREEARRAAEPEKKTQIEEAQPDRVTVTARTDRARQTFQDRYDEALQTYRSRNFSAAIQSFQELLNESMTHSLSDNAQYWIGESYWGLAQYQQAVVAFQKVFTFPQSNKDPDAQLKIGLCYLQLGDNERAREAFEKVINNYPTSEYVSVARRYLQDLNR